MKIEKKESFVFTLSRQELDDFKGLLADAQSGYPIRERLVEWSSEVWKSLVLWENGESV